MLEAGFLCFQRLLFDDSEVLSSTMAGCLLGNMYMKSTEKTPCVWSYHVQITQLQVMCQGRNLCAF